MKKIIGLAFFMSLAMLLMPLSAMDGNLFLTAETVQTGVSVSEKEEKSSDIFRLYDPETKKITEIEAEEYIFGVVAAEMPALYEEEALKAQAVAAYTYACYRREQMKNETYDLSTDPTDSQCFITVKEAEKRWGEKAEKYTKKIKSAIEETSGYAITYNGDIILSVYHAISAGKTRNSGDVWGEEYPYLKAVDSSWDKEAENYKTEVSFTAEELETKLSSLVKLSGKAEEYLGETKLCDAGYVNEISICGSSVKGSQVREALDLRSNCFTMELKDGKFIFTVYGYGHGTGMSQNGANALAKQGKDFEEILRYYYTDCEVEKINP